MSMYLCVGLLCVFLCVCSLSLVLSSGGDEAASSCVRVCIWVIRSPETLRLACYCAVTVPHPGSRVLALSLCCVAVFWFCFCN